jgi:hypothetical protein
LVLSYHIAMSILSDLARKDDKFVTIMIMTHLDFTAFVAEKLDPTLDSMSSSYETFGLSEGENMAFTF